MASSINSTSAGNGGLVSTGDDSGILNIQTNETTAITVDASQNVGIGTTSPVSRLQVANTTATRLTISKAADSITNNEELGSILWRINGGAGTVMGNIYYTGNAGSSGDGTGALVFGARGNNNATTLVESMRIDSSGNLLVGTTTSLASGLTVSGGNGPQFSINTTTRYAQMNFYNSGTQKSFIAWDNTNTNLYVQNSSGGVYLTNTGTSWTSNSDERLKENLVPITDALTKVNTLRAVVGNFISDETKKKTPFLIAQDVKAVLPEAVTSSTLKDDETNTEYFGIAYTETIPLLVAAIKELKAINDTQAETINALTARIVALEQA